MEHPLIDLDINFLTERTLEVAKMIPDYRFKPLLAIVRGVGGGKSRCIEELKLSLNKKEDVLALAITFNHKTPFNLLYEIWDTENVLLFSALSYISRIASSFYDEEFTDILKRMRQTFSKTIKPYENDVNGEDLIRSFIKFVLNTPKAQSIKTLVVLVDEVIKFEDVVKESINLQKSKILLFLGNKFEANSVLRSAVLNTKIFDDRIINVALVVSSLQSNPLGKSSRRVIKALVLPVNLNPSKLIKLWIARDVYKDLDSDTIKRMEFFATSINSNPRMCEYAHNVVE
eukprot:gene35262-47390_t